MEQWGSESDFFKVTGSGVKRGFSGEGAAGFSRFGKGQGRMDGGRGRGWEVKIPALRFAIGRGTRVKEVGGTLAQVRFLLRLGIGLS